ncbi:hypothetical protein VTK73DRAFT_9196 [Phialemonium thermophilum]|uniref:Uncharacterized protein n=1 Tax=Phialemonium thermophilum TaxID=223376 RepID=A0ABR3XLE9_9PEZI
MLLVTETREVDTKVTIGIWQNPASYTTVSPSLPDATLDDVFHEDVCVSRVQYWKPILFSRQKFQTREIRGRSTSPSMMRYLSNSRPKLSIGMAPRASWLFENRLPIYTRNAMSLVTLLGDRHSELVSEGSSGGRDSYGDEL